MMGDKRVIGISNVNETHDEEDEEVKKSAGTCTHFKTGNRGVVRVTGKVGVGAPK